MARHCTLALSLLLSLSFASPEAGALPFASPAPQAPQVAGSLPDLLLVGKRGRDKTGRHHGRRAGKAHRAHKARRAHRYEWFRQRRAMRAVIARKTPKPRIERRQVRLSPIFGPLVMSHDLGATTAWPRPATTVLSEPKPEAMARQILGDDEAAPLGPSLSRTNPDSEIDCDGAAAIVGTYGFSSMTPKNCDGDRYVFDAVRDTQLYLVAVNARDGELVQVSKYKGPESPELSSP